MTDEINLYPTLADEILFLNIGRGDDDFFNWKQPASSKVFTRLDVLALRAYPGEPEYFLRFKDARHETKTVIKQFVPEGTTATQSVTFIAVAELGCQFQIIEAFIEYLAKLWFSHYSFSTMETASSEDMFAGFRRIVDDAFTEVPKRCLEKCQVFFKPVNQIVDVFVKKSLVTQASSLPVALVFEHEPYHMLLFLDAKFKVREQKLVDYSG
ncbi:MAG TPA: hypothetical protein VKK79_15890 [Candidatus Lokiarchaeia archaeon]|nr:hypothetical protein [Candidatus Lokiarchaeia archaeon]